MKAGCSVMEGKYYLQWLFEVTTGERSCMNNAVIHNSDSAFDLNVKLSLYLCSCPSGQTLLLITHAWTVCHDETSGVLPTQACPTIIKHLPRICVYVISVYVRKLEDSYESASLSC